MQSTSQPGADRALIVMTDLSAAEALQTTLRANGIEGVVEADERAALELCRTDTPDLAIVGEPLESMSVYQFVTELLKVSWTVSTILITEDDPETVHEKAEGLGILGSISRPHDREELEELLKEFKRLRMS